METQKSINEWADSVFGNNYDIAAARNRAVDEMGEFIVARDISAVITEAADIVITLYRLAAVAGFDLQTEIDRKMQINRARVWIAHGDGTGHHV
jgi:hypothetical protein